MFLHTHEIRFIKKKMQNIEPIIKKRIEWAVLRHILLKFEI